VITSLSVFPLFQHAFRISKERRLAFHQHDFWQLELVHEGRFSFLLENEDVTLAGGSALLIAPGIRHAFQYPAKPAAWSSFKFKLDGLSARPPFRRWELCELEADLAKVLWQLATQSSGPLLHARVRLIIEALLLPLTSENSAAVSPRQHKLSEKVEQHLARLSGRRTTVKQLANLLGYDADYLSTRYQMETGESLKRALDHGTAAKAGDLLEHTLLSATEIADLLGFNDLFSFSRFCKRCLGASPSHYRNR
jgi:AraC-like DNA-binding protein